MDEIRDLFPIEIVKLSHGQFAEIGPISFMKMVRLSSGPLNEILLSIMQEVLPPMLEAQGGKITKDQVFNLFMVNIDNINMLLRIYFNNKLDDWFEKLTNEDVFDILAKMIEQNISDTFLKKASALGEKTAERLTVIYEQQSEYSSQMVTS